METPQQHEEDIPKAKPFVEKKELVTVIVIVIVLVVISVMVVL